MGSTYSPLPNPLQMIIDLIIGGTDVNPREHCADLVTLSLCPRGLRRAPVGARPLPVQDQLLCGTPAVRGHLGRGGHAALCRAVPACRTLPQTQQQGLLPGEPRPTPSGRLGPPSLLTLILLVLLP